VVVVVVMALLTALHAAFVAFVVAHDEKRVLNELEAGVGW
jgi:hypothetical protein